MVKLTLIQGDCLKILPKISDEITKFQLNLNISNNNNLFMEKKKCAMCKQEKPINEFYLHYNKYRNKYYRTSYCKECLKKYKHQQYLKHRTKIIEKVKEYIKKNPEIKKKQYEYRKKWRYTSPLGIYSIVKQSAKRRKIPFKISKEEFKQWFNQNPQKCFYCGITVEELKNMKDSMNLKSKRLTIDRLDNKKGYTIDNIVWCCYRCNAIKGDFFTVEEMKKIGEIIKKKLEGLK